MNERIRELIKSCGIIPEDEHYEVAELIVRECVSIVSKRKNQAIDDGCNIDEAMSMAEMDIEEHFGVK